MVKSFVIINLLEELKAFLKSASFLILESVNGKHRKSKIQKKLTQTAQTRASRLKRIWMEVTPVRQL